MLKQPQDISVAWVGEDWAEKNCPRHHIKPNGLAPCDNCHYGHWNGLCYECGPYEMMIAGRIYR